jgi:hypothetical protein
VHRQWGWWWSPPEKWCFPMLMIPLDFPLSQEYLYISTNKVHFLLRYFNLQKPVGNSAPLRVWYQSILLHFEVEDIWGGHGGSVTDTFVCFLLFLVLLVVMLCVVAFAALFCFCTGLWRDFCAAFAWSSLFDFPSSVRFFYLEETCHCRLPHTCLFFEIVILMNFSVSLFCPVFGHDQVIGAILFCANVLSIPASSPRMFFPNFLCSCVSLSTVLL